jgi:hypothetical protein
MELLYNTNPEKNMKGPNLKSTVSLKANTFLQAGTGLLV